MRLFSLLSFVNCIQSARHFTSESRPWAVVQLSES